MRSDVQEIFQNTPHNKQVMMFSATLSQGNAFIVQKIHAECKTKCILFLTHLIN